MYIYIYIVVTAYAIWSVFHQTAWLELKEYSVLKRWGNWTLRATVVQFCWLNHPTNLVHKTAIITTFEARRLASSDIVSSLVHRPKLLPVQILSAQIANIGLTVRILWKNSNETQRKNRCRAIVIYYYIRYHVLRPLRQRSALSLLSVNFTEDTEFCAC